MSQANVEVVRQLFDAFNGGKPWESFLAPEIEVRLHDSDVVYHGIEGARRAAQDSASTTGRWVRELLIDADDRVVGLFHHFRSDGRHGAEIREQLAVVYTLRGGRVVRSQRFISWHTALASVHDAADGRG